MDRHPRHRHTYAYEVSFSEYIFSVKIDSGYLQSRESAGVRATLGQNKYLFSDGGGGGSTVYMNENIR